MTVWNAADKSANLAITGGLRVTHPTGDYAFGAVRADGFKTTGKYYFETTYTTSGNIGVGVANATATLGNIGTDTNGSVYFNSGYVSYNGNIASYSAVGAGGVVGVAIDPDNDLIWYSLNGVFNGNPAAGTGGLSVPGIGTFYPVTSSQYPEDDITANFGGSAFAYSAPSGFSAWDASAATNYTLTAAVGAFALSGQVANLVRGYRLTAAVGAFTLSGQAALFRFARKVAANVGAFVLTGRAAGLNRGRFLSANTGAFTLSGQAVTFNLGKGLAAHTGVFTLAGQDAGLKAGRSFAANVGTFTITGQDASLKTGRTFPASVGAVSLSGQDAGLTIGRTFQASAGDFDLTGQDATLTLVTASGSRTLTAEAGAFSFTGMAATLIRASEVIYGPPRNDNRTIYGAARSDDVTITGPARDNSIVIAA